jgi:galactose mutarotase-like enzyme
MISSISNDYLTASFKTFGAELVSLKSKNQEYIWNGNIEFWGKHSPVLFPIVGTLKNNTFNYKNEIYTLNRHGFARELEFEIISKSQSSIIFSLKANEKTLENYPFIFELQIKYTLDANTLKVNYFVLNNSKTQMPFSIGAHPAISLPKNFENYSLKFSNDENLKYHLLDNGLISDKIEKIFLDNKVLKLRYKTFENDALVFKKIKSKSITVFEKSKPYIKVQFKDFPNLGIWTVQNAKFICIEPWFGYSDTINSNGNLFDKEGIIILEKNNQFLTEFSIEIL